MNNHFIIFYNYESIIIKRLFIYSILLRDHYIPHFHLQPSFIKITPLIAIIIIIYDTFYYYCHLALYYNPLLKLVPPFVLMFHGQFVGTVNQRPPFFRFQFRPRRTHLHPTIPIKLMLRLNATRTWKSYSRSEKECPDLMYWCTLIFSWLVPPGWLTPKTSGIASSCTGVGSSHWSSSMAWIISGQIPNRSKSAIS